MKYREINFFFVLLFITLHRVAILKIEVPTYI